MSGLISGRSLLSQHCFLGTASKVRYVEFHPVQPWIVVLEQSDCVTVFNWLQQEVVFQKQFGGVDDDVLLQDALQARAEKDPAFFGKAMAGRLNADLAAASRPSGRVRSAKFLDVETVYWQTALQMSALLGPTCRPPDATSMTALLGTRLVVLVCDYKVVLYDIVRKRTREIPRGALDGKSPTAVSVLVSSGSVASDGAAAAKAASSAGMTLMSAPVLAVGCSDGIIRLVSFVTLEVIGKLVAAHKGGVTALLTLTGMSEGAPDRLVSGDASGTIAVWEPFSQPLGVGNVAEITPTTLRPQAHTTGIADALIVHGPEDTDQTLGMLLTFGQDGSMLLWDGLSFQEVRKMPPIDKNVPYNAIAYTPRHLAVSNFIPTCVVTAAAPIVYGVHHLSGAVRELAHIDGIIPAGKKPQPKIYSVASCALQPHIIAVACNTGTAVFKFDVYERLCIAPLVAPSATAAESQPLVPDMSPPPAEGAKYMLVMGSNLFEFHWTAREVATTSVSTRRADVQLVARKQLASLGQGGRCIVQANAGGDMVAVCWPVARSYEVFVRTASGAWVQRDAGSAVQVVWHQSDNLLAVIDEPPPPEFNMPAVQSGSPRKAKGPDIDALKAAYMVATADAANRTRVVIREMPKELSKPVKVVCARLELRGDTPTSLHGGVLLGVGLRRMVERNDDSGRAPALQFFNWHTQERVGTELEEPKWIAWDNDMEFCALAYAHGVQLFGINPRFVPLVLIPLTNPTSGMWGRRVLHVVTPSSVETVFAVPAGMVPEDAPGSMIGLKSGSGEHPHVLIQIVRLASFAGSRSSSVDASAQHVAALPYECTRPEGPAVVLGVHGDMLWLADAHGWPHALPLNHPGLKARLEAAAGNYTAARAMAEEGLAPVYHDGIALFMSAAASSDALGPESLRTTAERQALQEALELSGLSLEVELQLSALLGDLKRAVACLVALLAGINTRQLMSDFPAWKQRYVPPAAAPHAVTAAAAASTPLDASLATQELGADASSGSRKGPIDLSELLGPDEAASAAAATKRSNLAAARQLSGRGATLAAASAFVADPEMPFVRADGSAINWDAVDAALTALSNTPDAGTAAAAAVLPRSDGGVASTQSMMPVDSVHYLTADELSSLAMLVIDTALAHNNSEVAAQAMRALSKQMLAGVVAITPQHVALMSQLGLATQLKQLAQSPHVNNTTAGLIATVLARDSGAAVTQLQRNDATLPLAAVMAANFCAPGAEQQPLARWNHQLLASAETQHVVPVTVTRAEVQQPQPQPPAVVDGAVNAVPFNVTALLQPNIS